MSEAPAPERPAASYRTLLVTLGAAALAFALSVPLAPALPLPVLAGAALAFACVALAISAVAVLTPTATPRQALWLALPLLVLTGVALGRSALPPALASNLVNVSLLGFGAVLGSAVGGRVEHAGHLVLLAWVASVVDIVSVFVPEGPTAQIVASPEVALPLVTLSWPIFATESIEPLIGVGDITIASVYGAAARSTGLARTRVVAGLLVGFALTFVALLVFQRALPALPMLSAAVVVALAPASLRVPPADRVKGIGFVAVLTVLVTARLITWAAAP